MHRNHSLYPDISNFDISNFNPIHPSGVLRKCHSCLAMPFSVTCAWAFNPSELEARIKGKNQDLAMSGRPLEDMRLGLQTWLLWESRSKGDTSVLFTGHERIC